MYIPKAHPETKNCFLHQFGERSRNSNTGWEAHEQDEGCGLTGSSWLPKNQRTSGCHFCLPDSQHENGRWTVSSDREQDRVSLTHILNKEGVCLRIHLDVFKTFQWLPIGNVVMLHGSTGSIFGWVPCDFQAHFSGHQFHVPWLQWVVSYANSATINLQEG